MLGVEGALSQPMAMQLQAHSITTPQSFYSQLYYLTAAQPVRHSLDKTPQISTNGPAASYQAT
jgi:hypothetical protein